MNKKAQAMFLGIIAVLIIITIFILLFVFKFPSEDSWIKDSRGVYVKHGVPSQIPDDVLEQQKAIDYAIRIYNMEKSKGVEFNSQCLGSVGENERYAIDIVHVPRVALDDLAENQCEDFRLGKVKHFIELNKDGNIVGVV